MCGCSWERRWHRWSRQRGSTPLLCRISAEHLPGYLLRSRQPQRLPLSPATPTQAAAAGTYKCNLPWWKIVLLGCVAGCYVGLGGALLLTGALPDGLELQPSLARLEAAASC